MKEQVQLALRVISIEFSKAFDSVPHNILLDKIKKMPYNPYIINWMIDLLSNRKQRVKVDGIVTEFLDINRGVPHGTVLGPMMFLPMTNDTRMTTPINQMSKFADDITIVAPVFNNVD